jgi:ribonuclease HIII
MCETEYSEIQIIDDLEEEDSNTNTNIEIKQSKKITTSLQKYHQNTEIYEIGIDEVGRGPLFGRVYTAAVILPKDDSFDHSKMKDSKKFHSKKKIEERLKSVAPLS